MSVGSKLMWVLFLFKSREMKLRPLVHSNTVIPSISATVDAGVKRMCVKSFMVKYSTEEKGKEQLAIKVAGTSLPVLRTIFF